jgi:transcriptional regulator with GAF, ATPase, and Fis domain
MEGTPEGSDGEGISRSIAAEVVRTASPVMTADAVEDERFRHKMSVKDLKLRSVLCVPLQGREGVIGAVYAEDREASGAFTPEDLEFLSMFSDQATAAIENARLLKENMERREELDRLNRQLQEKVKAQEASISALEEKVTEAASAPRYPQIIGRSAAMQKVFGLLDRFRDSDAPVMITGQSGTGKELVARALHYQSRRREHPFAAENCAALAESLLESELFGHEKGAFTGAVRTKQGLFEVSDKGTLFLDEMAEMSRGLQKKLLRVLEAGEIRRVGGKETIPVDVRIVSASNRDLEELVRAGQFREDLFYRLNVLRIHMPLLRERGEDIPLLVRHFLKRAVRAGREVEISAEAIQLLCAHDWPGNVRELENEIFRALALSGEVIRPEDLSPRIVESQSAGTGLNLRAKVQQVETDLIKRALAKTNGNRSQAAKLLGLSRYGLLKKIERLGIAPNERS